jgi:hypothetical protein
MGVLSARLGRTAPTSIRGTNGDSDAMRPTPETSQGAGHGEHFFVYTGELKSGIGNIRFVASSEEASRILPEGTHGGDLGGETIPLICHLPSSLHPPLMATFIRRGPQVVPGAEETNKAPSPGPRNSLAF